MRRSIIFLLAAGMFAVAAPAARAKSTCSVPDEPAWHSCLTARHATLSTGSVRLTRATPALVIRLQHGCPDRLAKRRVVLRTKAGTRIAAEKVTGSCRTDVARYRVHVRPDLELPAGTVIRSYWSGIRDDKVAPKVRIGAG
jgi:hypothetical protein